MSIIGQNRLLLSNAGETVEIDCALGATAVVDVFGSPTPNANLIIEVWRTDGINETWVTQQYWQTNTSTPSLVGGGVTVNSAAGARWVCSVQAAQKVRVRATSASAPTLVQITIDDEPISVPPLLGATQNVNAVASTSGGASQSSTLCASGTNITSVKASSGSLYGYEISNNGTAAYWVLFYNAAITLGTTVPVKRIFVPIGATIAMGTMVGESMAQIRFAVCTVANPTAGDAGVAVGDANRIAVNVRFA